MPNIAWTNEEHFYDQTLIYASLQTDIAPLTLLANFHTLFTAIGWDSIAYGNGHEYLLQSPQGLNAYLRVWYLDEDDPTYPDCLAFQMLSPNTGEESEVFHLDASYEAQYPGDPLALQYYLIWANACSFFIAEPGRTQTEVNSRSVCGGIPYAAGVVVGTPTCLAQRSAPKDTTNELWFLSGDDAGKGKGLGTYISFRSSYRCRRYAFCRNGSVTNIADAGESASLQLAILRPAGYEFGAYPALRTGLESGFEFADGAPLLSQPFLVHDGYIHGQLYDAVLASHPMALEAPEVIEYQFPAHDDVLAMTVATNWNNHTSSYTGHFNPPDDGRLYALLLLRKNRLSVVGRNYAY